MLSVMVCGVVVCGIVTFGVDDGVLSVDDIDVGVVEFVLVAFV